MSNKVTHIKIEFFFGIGFRGDGSRILILEQQRIVRAIKRDAARILGAWTLVESVGGWQNVVEPGFVLSTVIIASNVIPDTVKSMADAIKEHAQQQSIFVAATPVNAVEY